jgi:hypothetical protein
MFPGNEGYKSTLSNGLTLNERMTNWKYRDDAFSPLKQQVVYDLIDQQNVHLEIELRKSGTHRGDGLWDQAAARATGAAKPEQASVSPCHTIDSIAQLIELPVYAPHQVEKNSCLVRRYEPSSSSLEKLESQNILSAFYDAREARLSHPQHLRGSVDRTGEHHGPKYFDLTEAQLSALSGAISYF